MTPLSQGVYAPNRGGDHRKQHPSSIGTYFLPNGQGRSEHDALTRFCLARRFRPFPNSPDVAGGGLDLQGGGGDRKRDRERSAGKIDLCTFDDDTISEKDVRVS